MQTFSSETLMGELGSWNKQETKFRDLFSDQALKDREFQKMKLAEYDRLWIKYNGNAITTDERALLVMLKFQRTKMEKALYPGLLRRLFRKGINTVKNIIRQRGLRAQFKRNDSSYNYNTIPVPDTYTQNRDPLRQSEQRQRFGQDLGRKQKNNPNKRQGQSL